MNTSPNAAATHEKRREAADFAVLALRNYHTYSDLAALETHPLLAELLTNLAAVAKDEFSFWGQKGMVREDQVPRKRRFFFSLWRRVYGSERIVRQVIAKESARLNASEVYCRDCLSPEEHKVSEVLHARLKALLATYEANTTL